MCCACRNDVGVGQWFRSLLVINYVAHSEKNQNPPLYRDLYLIRLPSHALCISSCRFWSVRWLVDWLNGSEERPWSVYGTCSNSIRQTRKSFMKSSKVQSECHNVNSEMCCPSPLPETRVTLFVELICKLWSAASYSATAFLHELI